MSNSLHGVSLILESIMMVVAIVSISESANLDRKLFINPLQPLRMVNFSFPESTNPPPHLLLYHKLARL